MTQMPFFHKNTITREHLAKAIRRHTGINITITAEMVDHIIDIMTSSILETNQLKIRLFGSFSTRTKSARIGRNPKTMIEAAIPARKVVKFKAAPTLKKMINDNIQSIA
jgi:integration host factor subunit alpha